MCFAGWCVSLYHLRHSFFRLYRIVMDMRARRGALLHRLCTPIDDMPCAEPKAVKKDEIIRMFFLLL
jgi:hypothetical protein